jgi:hypothetical protein
VRFVRFDTVIEHELGDGVSLLVKEARLSQSGLVEARIQLWNGKLLYSDVVQTGKQAEREKCLEALLKKARSAKVKVKGSIVATFLLDLDASLSDQLAAYANAGNSENEKESDEGLPYHVSPEGLTWMKPMAYGNVPVQLTNFIAEIKSDTIEDDGAETRCVFDIEAKLKGRVERFSIGASQFASMRWPVEYLGTQAVIFPGYSDHARCAIQLLSRSVERQRKYTHTGWRKIDGEYGYLHAGGAIGREGNSTNVGVRLSPELSNFILPEPPKGNDLREAIIKSLNLLDVATRTITFPMLAAIYRAVIGECDFSIYLVGPSGAGKSELAAQMQQHFGAALDARHLPASWSNTANVNEALGFTLKDMLMVVDDFAPTGSATDIQRQHRDADRLLRAQGNHAGRQRMRADTSLRPDKPPRGLIVSTGEDVPRGKSLRARTLVQEVGPNDVDWIKLTQSQDDAAAGLYVSGMSGFIRWMAGQYEGLQQKLRQELSTLRNAAARSGMHKRTPEIVANLALGLKYFLRFAYESKAITKDELNRYWREGWSSFGQAALLQARYHSASDPVQLYLDLLQAAMGSGRAHVAHYDGSVPADASAWGWWRQGDDWQAKGNRVGWLDGDNLYLEKDASLAAVQAIGNQTGEALSISGTTLHKRLHERELLVTTDKAHETLYVRRKLEGVTRNVLHLSARAVGFSTDKKTDKPDIDEVSSEYEEDSGVGYEA